MQEESHGSANRTEHCDNAVTHGLTVQHMANEPHLPVGSGRYGGLIPAAVALFAAAWEMEQPSEQDEGDSGD